MESRFDEQKLALINELLESSSDSSDDMLEDELVERRVIPKIKDYVRIVLEEYDDEEFRKNFRVSRGMFSKLNEMYGNSDFISENNHGLPSISTESQILQFLWFAGNKCVIRDVASRFDVAVSTCHKIIENIVNFLNEISPQIIKFPRTEDEKAEVAEKFQQISGFPGIIGAIDGTYITISTPAHKVKSTYVNRHDQTSLTLQGICDADKLFIDVFTGVSGKLHDSTVFKHSFIYEEIRDICGKKWHLIGDAAYGIKEWLMVPFRDYGDLTQEQTNFNFKLSQHRVKIENSFGSLKGRFRQLQRLDFFNVLKKSKFIVACCVLHNLCILNDDEWDELCNDDNGDAGDNNDDQLANVNENIEKRLGEMKRIELCQQLWDNR